MTAHELPVRVYYEDTDAAGIVYHANYLKFAERGRTEFLRSVGFDHRVLADAHGLVFAVARCVTDFVTPARLDDLLLVRTRVAAVRGARLELDADRARATGRRSPVSRSRWRSWTARPCGRSACRRRCGEPSRRCQLG